MYIIILWTVNGDALRASLPKYPFFQSDCDYWEWNEFRASDACQRNR